MLAAAEQQKITEHRLLSLLHAKGTMVRRSGQILSHFRVKLPNYLRSSSQITSETSAADHGGRLHLFFTVFFFFSLVFNVFVTC